MQVYTPEQFADRIQRTLFADGQVRPMSGADDGVLVLNVVDLTAGEKALVRASWLELGAATGLRVVETTGPADITYRNDGTRVASTSASYDSDSTSRAVITISSDRVNPGDGVGSFAFRTYMHETAHALGLGHPQNYGTVREFSQSAIANDSWQMSMMSYFDQNENTWVNATYARQITPMLADYLALRDMYGAVPVRAGQTVYGVGSTAGGALDKMVTLGSAATMLIADTGGWDRLDLSAFSARQVIDLRPGKISDVMGAVGNLQIAPDTRIEEATGGTGNDWLIGNGAANILDGRGGSDRMDGGAGNDHYFVTAGDRVVEGDSGGIDRMVSAGSLALAAFVENGQLVGGAAANVVGNALNNVIGGNGAANILNGGGGSDVLRGGAGNDHYFVTAGDRVVEGASGGIDRMLSAGSLALAAFVENGQLVGGAAASIAGNGLNNMIVGNGVANTLDGVDGSDVLLGGGGNDRYLTNGGDQIVETGAAGNDTVRSSANHVLAANVENLILTGAAARGIGNVLSNVINGNGAGNVLNGQAGDDFLFGGVGADHFVFGDGVDRVRDFQDDVDSLIFLRAALGLENEAQVMSRAVQSGANVIFDFGADDLIVFNTTIDAVRNDVGLA